MEQYLKSPRNLIHTSQKHSNTLVGLIIFFGLVYFGSILQDHIYSNLKNTGFYWSEVLVHNIFWLLFIPTVYLKIKISAKYTLNGWKWFAAQLIDSLFLAVLHIFVFTSLFIAISYFFFHPTHDYFRILKTSFAKDFMITFFLYLFLPLARSLVIRNRVSNRSTESYLTIQDGASINRILVDSIVYCQTDRPYVVIYQEKGKLLTRYSLNELSNKIDRKYFKRIHRSTIVNQRFIQSFQSRKNGDFDVLLYDGKILRASRHYRSEFDNLINSA